MINCKKDKIDAQPDEIMKPLVGKWYLTEVEQIVNGEKVWVPFAGYEAIYTNFRFDGVELYENGKASCCAPKTYYINNTRYEVVPKKEVSYSFDCSLVDCMPCPSYTIEVNGNQMMIARCSSARSKYLRAE
ncbi:hypothetical protein [Dyadobacter frigoris]|uniref:Lipocalin-like domain-containing protein n=1 Tax=Dyadobacter frigoris TaxID=2576211 RepID=A0A4V6BIS4_9BACT|nr:hypothetical protein [Dyadobacter frigoris]TKT91493.1 hypothetical protein FDK13_14060 [Dyadobacter frigoris]